MHPIYCEIYFVLPSAFDILRYILSCRAIAIYDLPINLRYIYKRVSPLIGGHHFLLCQQTNTKDIAGQSAKGFLDKAPQSAIEEIVPPFLGNFQTLFVGNFVFLWNQLVSKIPSSLSTDVILWTLDTGQPPSKTRTSRDMGAICLT